ncbi:hypothetical protein IW22_06850 [Chryseobacterium sp. JM1]|nr:hypothetical protein IW22_06850 [Chryseobacterium sp. JM1]
MCAIGLKILFKYYYKLRLGFYHLSLFYIYNQFIFTEFKFQIAHSFEEGKDFDCVVDKALG